MDAQRDASNRSEDDAETAAETEPSTRHNDRLGYTAQHINDAWQRAFLDTLRRTGNVSSAAAIVGVSRKHVYATVQDDPAFAEAFADGRETVCDGLEESLAVRGQRSDTPAAIAYLKAYRPAVWDRARQVDIRTTSYSEEVTRLEVAYTPDQLLAMYEAMRQLTATATATATGGVLPDPLKGKGDESKDA